MKADTWGSRADRAEDPNKSSRRSKGSEDPRKASAKPSKALEGLARDLKTPTKNSWDLARSRRLHQAPNALEISIWRASVLRKIFQGSNQPLWRFKNAKEALRDLIWSHRALNKIFKALGGSERNIITPEKSHEDPRRPHRANPEIQVWVPGTDLPQLWL